MVSMVIVLFLVAVSISLFFGRLAEVLIKRFDERTRTAGAAEHLPATEHLPAPGSLAVVAVETHGSKAA
jgi:hypothetical protein